MQEHRRVRRGGPSIHLGGRDRAPGDMRPLDGGCDCSDNRCEVSSRSLESHSDGHRREARRPPLVRDGLPKNPLQTIERVITPLSFYRADDELLRESRGTLAIPNLDVFLNDYAACDVFDIRERVSELSARTLIMCGEYDKLTPPIWSHYLNARILRSTAFFIRDSGHMVPLEKPDASGRLIIDFLATPSR